MTKLIGILLIISSIISLFSGVLVDVNYWNAAEITGRVAASHEGSGPTDYIQGALLSYAIMSFIMGMIFLFRV